MFHIIFISGLLIENILHLITNILNLKQLKFNINNPARPLKKTFNQKYLKKAYPYLKSRTGFSIFKNIFFLGLLLLLIYLKLFINCSLTFSRSFSSPVFSHLFFLGCLFLLYYIISLPFNIFHVFHIEKKFGFSTITLKTFILDNIKAVLLTVILGGSLLMVLFWFILKFHNNWWLWAWAVFTGFSLLLIKIFPSFIAPLFNKLEPLKGPLRKQIYRIADKAGFTLKNILKNDASKRSKHSNAYFTGFGKNKQIILFDTLMQQLNNSEITSVLAHEIGHYKKKHIWSMFIIQTMITGLTMYLIKTLLFLPSYLNTFYLDNVHYLTKFIFTLIFTNSVLWILQIPITMLSRRNEFTADTFAQKLIGQSRYLVQALIKLTKDNLSNPYPHPFYSWLYYSHPPLIERSQHLQKLDKKK